MSDDDLDRLLHDAVSDVQPHGTTDDIRNRTTKVIPMTNRWLPISLASAAAVALVVAGSLWLVQRNDDNGPDPASGPTVSQSNSSEPTPDSTPSSTPDTHDEVAIALYFAGNTPNGTRLFREFRRVESCGDPDCQPTMNASIAVDGPAEDPDYRTLWPGDAQVQWVKYDGKTISVSLSGDVRKAPPGTNPDDNALAIQQLVYTVQAAIGEGRKPVTLLVDGAPAETVLGHYATRSIVAADPLEVLSAVQISGPTEGATVSSGFTVTGVAATFEANVVWELKQGDTIVKQGHATARECCKLAPYSFKVSAPAGTYTLVVHDEDMSDGEGAGVTQDTRTVTIR